MRLSDLQEKDIVNMNDGKKVGRIIDVDIDLSGKINYLLVEELKGFKRFMSKDYEINITFDKIKKIGEDVILVDI